MCQPDTKNREPALNGSEPLRKDEKERFCSAQRLWSCPRGNERGKHAELAETNTLPGCCGLQTAPSWRNQFPRRGRAGLSPPGPGSHLVAEIDEQHGLQEADEGDADLQGHTGEAPRGLSRCSSAPRPGEPLGGFTGGAELQAQLLCTPTKGCSPAQPTEGFFCPPRRCVTCEENPEGVSAGAQLLGSFPPPLNAIPRPRLVQELLFPPAHFAQAAPALQINHSQGLPMDLILGCCSTSLKKPHHQGVASGSSSSSHLHPFAPTSRQS